MSDWTDYKDNLSINPNDEDHERLMGIAQRFQLVLMEDFCKG